MNYGLFGLMGLPAGIDAVRNVARAVQGAADTLEPEVPEIAGFVREAAHAVERLSSDLRERSLGEIAASVTNFAKEEPVAFLGGAILAGFIIARLATPHAAGTAPRYLPAPDRLRAVDGDNRGAARARSL